MFLLEAIVGSKYVKTNDGTIMPIQDYIANVSFKILNQDVRVIEDEVYSIDEEDHLKPLLILDPHENKAAE
jgi:hypothetical protein